MLERGTHHLQLVLDVFQALASLLLDVMGHHLAFSRPFLLGSSARGIFKGIAPRLPREKQNIHVALCPEPSAPVHLFLMVVRPERAPIVLNFSLLRELECFRIGGHGLPRITVCYTCIELHTLVYRGQANLNTVSTFKTVRPRQHVPTACWGRTLATVSPGSLVSLLIAEIESRLHVQLGPMIMSFNLYAVSAGARADAWAVGDGRDAHPGSGDGR